MSKAFKGEDASEAPLVVPPRAPLPPGVENYVTAGGLVALKAEHERLLVERARAETSAAVDDGDRPRTLAMLGERVAALEDRLATARLVEPGSQPHGEVRFGACRERRGASLPHRRRRRGGCRARTDRVRRSARAGAARKARR